MEITPGLAGNLLGDGGAKTSAALSLFSNVGFSMDTLTLFFRVKDLSIRPGTVLKENGARHFPIPFADDPNIPEVEKICTEGGAESVVDSKHSLAENLIYTTKRDMFSILKDLNQTEVIWDHLLTAEVCQSMATSFQFQRFYDRDISEERQLKQTLAVGLSFLLFKASGYSGGGGTAQRRVPRTLRHAPFALVKPAQATGMPQPSRTARN